MHDPRSSAADYRQQAQDCLRLAAAAFNPRIRDRLIERAAHFKSLARQADLSDAAAAARFPRQA